MQNTRNQKAMAEELAKQVPLMKEMLKAMGVTIVWKKVI